MKMATKEEIDPEYPPSPEPESGEEQSGEESETEEPEEAEEPADNKDHVARLLQQLQSSGAIVKKPAPAPPAPLSPPAPPSPPSPPPRPQRCVTCDLTFDDWASLEDHLLQHVTLPKVLVDRLPSDDESEPDREPGDDWSDDDEPKPGVDVSEILKNKFLSIQKTNDTSNVKAPDSALNKLAGLGGFTIKKNGAPTKTDEPQDNKDDLMSRLGKLGGLKLKLQTTSQGNQNSFKIVNGLKEFNTEDDDDDWSGKEDDKSEEGNGSRKSSESEEASPNKAVQPTSPVSTPETTSTTTPTKSGVKVVKVLRIIPKPPPGTVVNTLNAVVPDSQSNMSNVFVKDEPQGDSDKSFPGFPLFANQVKSERTTPPPSEANSVLGTIIKTETDTSYTSSNVQPSMQITEITDPPLQPKKEKDPDPVAVIEINGDSNDEDDDCCVVSTTPAADIKPKIENIGYPPPSNVTYPAPPAEATTAPTILSSRLGSSSSYSTEKQHNFNWNAPDQKTDILEKSADAIFESLLSSANQKKEPMNSMSDASEYISLDRLGPQHTCEICNTRFTDLTLLENHRRMTGHSKSLVAPGASALLPAYSSSNSLISSLFPVKQLAEQVGRLSAVGTNSSSPFTHQQNVMINIQAYPGQLGSGMMAAPQQYGAYAGQQPTTSYQAAPPNSNMYRMPGQTMPGQTMPGQTMPPPGQNFAGQYQPQQYPPVSYATSTGGFITVPGSPSFSTSPLQGMQQAFGSGHMGSPQHVPGPLGPPGPMLAPGQMGSPQFAPPSSPNSMKPPPAPGNIRIQNVQSFSPGGQGAPGQGLLRGAAPMRGGSRPRMPGVRGARPSIRPGLQVQGQGVRGGKAGGPRMPMKRPAGVPPQGAPGKKRMDMLLPGKHDNEDCTVMAMQKQRDGLPMINSVHGSKDNFNLGSQISITKKTVNKEASGMASLLAARGIMVKQKAKSRSPSPERPVPHIPNLGAGVSIKHTSRSSEFSIPEAKVGGGMYTCRVCKKMFMNANSLSVHMSTAHPNSKVSMFRCDECPASYPKPAQLQHHKRVFHNVSGPDRELGLPVVDLSQEDTLKRLSDLGIYSFIPLANREQASGCFGIPVISVHNMNNGMVRGLTALGADGLLSLGPLKPLPNT